MPPPTTHKRAFTSPISSAPAPSKIRIPKSKIRNPMNLLFPLIALSLALHPLSAKPPVAPIAEPTTLIVATPFDQPAPPTRKGPVNGWQAGIGEWTVKDGALHGTELEADHHHSSCTYRLDATDLIISAQFRLGTATQIAFGCRDTIAPNNHLARTYVSPSAIWITHMSGIAKTTKSEKPPNSKSPSTPMPGTPSLSKSSASTTAPPSTTTSSKPATPASKTPKASSPSSTKARTPSSKTSPSHTPNPNHPTQINALKSATKLRPLSCSLPPIAATSPPCQIRHILC